MNRKISGRGLTLLLVLCVVLCVWTALNLPCPVRTLLGGIPCPGCGMSRAWLAALRLDFRAAFAFHPMFWSIPILGVQLLFDGRLFRNQWCNLALPVLIAVGLLGCYCFRIVNFLGGDMPV